MHPHSMPRAHPLLLLDAHCTCWAPIALVGRPLHLLGTHCTCWTSTAFAGHPLHLLWAPSCVCVVRAQAMVRYVVWISWPRTGQGRGNIPVALRKHCTKAMAKHYRDVQRRIYADGTTEAKLFTICI